MSSPRTGKLLGSTIGGAFAATIVWFMLSSMFGLGNAGQMAGRGSWWAEWYSWTAGGAALGIVVEFFSARRARRRSDALRDACRSLGLGYVAEVSRERFASGLPIFEKWQAAENGMTGKLDAVPVEAFDYTYREKGSGDSSDRDYRQTVAVLPAGENWPTFELQPRGVALRMLASALGFEGLVLESGDRLEQPAYNEFRRRYFLTGSHNAFGAATGADPYAFAPQPDGPPNVHDQAVARLFSPAVIRLLAQRPAWRLQCDGRRLAAWKHGRLAPPGELGAFLREALDLRLALIDSGKAKNYSRLAVDESPSLAGAAEPLARQAKTFGASFGAIAGFFGLGVLGMIGAGAYLMRFDEAGADRFFLNFAVAAVLFFGGAFGGLVVGAVLGGKLVSPLVLKQMQRRRERLLRENPNRPPGQPLTSNARMEESQGRLHIELPPLGLRRAGGCFLLLWCLGWNGMVLLFTAVFLPAAFAGQVEWNNGPETVSPWFAMLFLSPFWAIGLGLMTFLIHRGRRTATITLADGRLAVHEQTLFGARDRSWPAKEIEDLRLEVSRDTSPPQYSVAVHALKQPPARLFRYRPKEETLWLAGVLRRARGFELTQEGASSDDSPHSLSNAT
jgi:hypothetical protein